MKHVVHRIPYHQVRIVGAVRQTEARGQVGRLVQVVIVTVAGKLRRVKRGGRFGLLAKVRLWFRLGGTDAAVSGCSTALLSNRTVEGEHAVVADVRSATRIRNSRK